MTANRQPNLAPYDLPARKSQGSWAGLAFLILSLTSPLAANASPPNPAETIIQPLPAEGALDNPLKGWCPYVDAGPIRQPYSMVFQYVSWRELEPIEEDYRFAEWEQKWEVAAAANKRIIFRIYIDYPSRPSGLPQWLREAGVPETAYTDHGGGRAPDYNHPKMISAMERLIAALGKRYNNHPRVAFVQLGLLGFWGEWHTWPRSELYATPETEQRVIDAYRKAFPDKLLMARTAHNYAGRQKWIGFHDDMFPEDTDNGQDWSFLAVIRAASRTDNWKTAVIGGEMVPNQARKWLGTDFETTRAMLDRAHFTWVGPYCPALERNEDPVFLERSQQLVRSMGYDFQIREVKHASRVSAKTPLRVTLSGRNLGVAPFYYPWTTEWALLDSQGNLVQSQTTTWDIRRWLPGDFSESATLSFDVPPGSYQFAFGIRDPWQDRPAIRFANDLPVINGWSVLSTIEMSKSVVK